MDEKNIELYLERIAIALESLYKLKEKEYYEK
jgi:hypothetical protein